MFSSSEAVVALWRVFPVPATLSAIGALLFAVASSSSLSSEIVLSDSFSTEFGW